MPDTTPSHGAALAAYALAARALPLLAAPVLRRRLKRGKEDPARWREKHDNYQAGTVCAHSSTARAVAQRMRAALAPTA